MVDNSKRSGSKSGTGARAGGGNTSNNNDTNKNKKSQKKKKVTEKSKVEALGADLSKDVIHKFARGAGTKVQNIKDKKLKRKLKHNETETKHAAIRAAKWDMLLTENAGYLEAEGMEKTYKFSQQEILENVDQQTQQKGFELNLETLGPYRVNYSRSGRNLLIAGRKGHIAAMDWTKHKMTCELHLNETIRDIQWLHNETLFAVAQKKYTYIYDNTGAEVHVLRKHVEPTRLEFLPYHFLLASVGNTGFLKYQDVSTGSLVCEHRTKLGRCNVMKQNPYNAIINLGHANGTVTMWTPNMTTPVVKMMCHKGPVSALAVDRGGRYLTTSGLDGQMKIWDVRTYKLLHEYFTPTPASNLEISQTGLLGVSYGPHFQLWKDPFTTKQQSPYMTHMYGGKPIDNFQFVPYEDAVGIGHSKGISSLITPGAGDVNFDAYEVNIFQTKKQRREAEVKSLLEKIPSNLITLDPHSIGRIDRTPAEVIKREKQKAFEANLKDQDFTPKHKKRGRSKSQRRYLRKQANVIDAKKTMMREKMEQEKKKRMEKTKKYNEPKDSSVLNRFK